MEGNEIFLGFCNTPQTNAITLLSNLNDVLCRISLSILNLQGQCYYGASHMSGIHRGLHKLVLDENCKALYLYCAGHNPNLDVQDAYSAVTQIAKALEHMNKIVNFVRSSPNVWAFTRVLFWRS